MDFRRLIEHARAHAVVRPKSVGQRLATGQQPTVLFITCADGADIGHLPTMRRWPTRNARTGATTAFQPL